MNAFEVFKWYIFMVLIDKGDANGYKNVSYNIRFKVRLATFRFFNFVTFLDLMEQPSANNGLF